MSTPRAAGRPKAISREMLEEAACELFLEQGYGSTSVADITQRAGVSRATFFNYVESKSGLLWASVDDVLAAIEAGLTHDDEPADVLLRAAQQMSVGVAVLAIGNADAMGVEAELELTGAARQSRLARALADSLRAKGPLAADVLARAYAGAFFAAFEFWAQGDPGATSFEVELREALGLLSVGQ